LKFPVVIHRFSRWPVIKYRIYPGVRSLKALLFFTAVAVLSALGVVYTKYRIRLLFAETQRLEQVLIATDEEWGRLQLEQNTWAEHSRIETLARSRLGMILPPREAVIYIRP